MTSPNGLICFTNCLLAQEDGSVVEKDLWIDEKRGIILNAQRTFYVRKERPAKIIDLKGNILSPGFLDIQLNGGYGFDFSVYEDDKSYQDGMKMVASRIIETGVTSLLPTIITQEKSLYPKLLQLLRPCSAPRSATLLGWHAEGPFLSYAKRGAHAPPYLLPAPDGIHTLEKIYGAENLTDAEDWLMAGNGESVGVRMVTAAPEINGVMDAIHELTKKGIIFSIGHSLASSDIAAGAVLRGASLITHLFNAMPQLHHRDPSIIGLLGSSPYAFSSIAVPKKERTPVPDASNPVDSGTDRTGLSEAVDENVTPPQTPFYSKTTQNGRDKVELSRPYYGMIVDGIHSHPNTVRLAYSAHPSGFILVTDAAMVLDPHLKDGVHEWRDGRRFVKQGDKLTLEGTDTLAGSVVTMETSVRNFARFTGVTLGEAIKCATYNPARCLGIQNKKGTLRPGADADLVVLDKDGTVLCTWIKGKEAWTRGQ